MELPKISVILPVRNEVRSLGQLLEQLLQQNYPAEKLEILVADGRSTDGTPALVEQKASQATVAMRVIDNPGIRSGAGRNAGVAAATGDIILFIDGHCEIPSKDLLRDTAKLLEETGADCLCRPQPLIAFAPRGVGRIIADARASALGHGRDSLIYDMHHSGFVHPASSGATYRRAVFERVGMYDESFDACEDVEFNTRVAAAGYKAYTDPRLSVYYEPRKSFRGLFRQMMRYGVGRVRLARRHPESASMSQWAPAILLAGFAIAIISGVAAIASGNWILGVPAFPAAMFLLITIAASLHLGWRNGLTHALLGPVAYACIYLGLGTGMWTELAGIRRQRTRISTASTLPIRGA
ncbi:MAG TPA: glycosyltransferase [Acidobacteriaceae bacterium]|nr:glycosyltransferase [Acidobacteriaceae bacterium]